MRTKPQLLDIVLQDLRQRNRSILPLDRKWCCPRYPKAPPGEITLDISKINGRRWLSISKIAPENMVEADARDFALGPMRNTKIPLINKRDYKTQMTYSQPRRIVTDPIRS